MKDGGGIESMNRKGSKVGDLAEALDLLGEFWLG